MHPTVAEVCIECRKNLVTASYISPAMRVLHERCVIFYPTVRSSSLSHDICRAVRADVLLLNEIGLDPGIDHCSAIALLSSLRSRNLKPVSFVSFCGGLPSPECADIPLGYKFSWSPQGVLRAALNSANFRLSSKVRILLYM